MDTKLKKKLQEIILKAERSINAAELLFNAGDYDFSSSRSYYSVFYAIEAILLTKDIITSKHGRLLGEFNKNFIHSGTFPREYNAKISQLFRDRQEADYGFSSTILKEDAKDDLAIAKEIVSTIKSYLNL